MVHTTVQTDNPENRTAIVTVAAQTPSITQLKSSCQKAFTKVRNIYNLTNAHLETPYVPPRTVPDDFDDREDLSDQVGAEIAKLTTFIIDLDRDCATAKTRLQQLEAASNNTNLEDDVRSGILAHMEAGKFKLDLPKILERISQLRELRRRLYPFADSLNRSIGRPASQASSRYSPAVSSHSPRGDILAKLNSQDEKTDKNTPVIPFSPLQATDVILERFDGVESKISSGFDKLSQGFEKGLEKLALSLQYNMPTNPPRDEGQVPSFVSQANIPPQANTYPAPKSGSQFSIPQTRNPDYSRNGYPSAFAQTRVPYSAPAMLSSDQSHNPAFQLPHTRVLYSADEHNTKRKSAVSR